MEAVRRLRTTADRTALVHGTVLPGYDRDRGLGAARPFCLGCGGPEPPLVPVAGTGVVETSTIVRRAAADGLDPPYAVAIIALTEGPRLLSNVTPLSAVAIGAAVRLDWRPLPDGRNLPVFVLEE